MSTTQTLETPSQEEALNALRGKVTPLTLPAEPDLKGKQIAV